MRNEPSVARRRCTSGRSGCQLKGSVKVPRSVDRGPGDPNMTKKPVCARSSRSRHTGQSRQDQDRRARPTHRSGNSTATLRKGSPMKLSRRSGRCQRNRAISRMSLCVYLMQPLNRSALLSDIGMTPSLKHAPPANSTRFRFTRTWNAALILLRRLSIFASSLHAQMLRG